ncbi:hypothetical protein, partial [Streptomyces violascens]|uniref:hypothetical protein n=1 Tax=Streptomyces violascens TaxID=67381 RepID=UPI0036CF3E77
MHRTTQADRADARPAAAAAEHAGRTERVPVALPETVRAIAAGVQTVTDARRVTDRLPAFRDHRLSGELTTLINREPPRVFRPEATVWTSAGNPSHRAPACLYWRPAAQRGAEADGATDTSSAGPVDPAGRVASCASAAERPRDARLVGSDAAAMSVQLPGRIPEPVQASTPQRRSLPGRGARDAEAASGTRRFRRSQQREPDTTSKQADAAARLAPKDHG